MGQTSDFAEHLNLVKENVERARQQLERARQQLDYAQRARSFWDKLSAALEREHCAHALLLLRDGEAFLRELQTTDELTVRGLRGLCSELQARARSAASRIAQEFPTAAREAELHIDSTSRHPTYTFNQGFLRLEMDERNFTAKVLPRDGSPIVVGLDLDLVVQTIRSQQSRLFNRPIDSQAFLRRLYTAYLAVLRAEGRREGDELPLRRVMNRMAKNLNGFAADEFNIDLSSLVRKGDLMVDGKRVHLNHTRERRQGMLLHGLESGGYVGFISFKREKDR